VDTARLFRSLRSIKNNIARVAMRYEINTRGGFLPKQLFEQIIEPISGSQPDVWRIRT
jgi:hypothetical protein